MDVHSAKHELTLGGEVVRSLPTVRSYNALLVLVPGVVTNVNDIVTGTAATIAFPIHGGRTNEGRLALDGLTSAARRAAIPPTSYVDRHRERRESQVHDRRHWAKPRPPGS